MKRVDNIFDEMISVDNLHEAMLMASKHKLDHKGVKDFVDNEEEELQSLHDDLVNGTYVMGKYHEFYVFDPKKRLIMALPFRDRVAQWAIYRVINPIFDKRFIDTSYACRKGKGLHAAISDTRRMAHNMSISNKEVYFLKLDISKYFYRIDHTILEALIRRVIKDERVLDLLSYIINNDSRPFGMEMIDSVPTGKRIYGVGIPIGNLTSQMFANIYLNALDEYCKHMLSAKRYIRYMDDIIILDRSKKVLHFYREEITEFLATRLKLVLNRKTEVSNLRKGIGFCGYIIYGEYIKVRHCTLRKMWNKINSLRSQYIKGYITDEYVAQSVASYYGTLVRASAYYVRREVFGPSAKPNKDMIHHILLSLYYEMESTSFWVD